MNFKLEDLYKKFYPVPERILKHFYLCTHETINFSSSIDFQENVYGNLMKSQPISRNSNKNSLPKKFNSNTSELVNFITCLEKYHSFEDRLMTDFTVETPKNNSENHNIPVTSMYSEMSVEEIDRNYRALKLQDMTSVSFDIGFDNNFDSSCTYSAIPSHSSSPDSFSSNDNYTDTSFGSVPKKKKYDNFVTQNDLNNTYIGESQIYYSKKSKYSKDNFKNLKNPIKLSQHDNAQLIKQNNVNNVSITKSQTSFPNVFPSYKLNYLNEIMDAPQSSEDGDENLQNHQILKLKHPQYENDLVPHNDFNNIPIKASQTREFESLEHYYHKLTYPLRKDISTSQGTFDLPSKSNNFDETNHSSIFSENNNAVVKNEQLKQCNFSKYQFNKRKNADIEFLSQSKFAKCYSQDLPNCSPEVQKGQSSKIVCPLRKDISTSQDTFIDLPSKSNNIDETNHSSIFSENNNAVVKSEQLKQCNFSKYQFNKRKNADIEFLNQSKFAKCYSQDLPKCSPKVQKGQSSKTVCKQVSFKNSPIFCDDENSDFVSSSDVIYLNTSSQILTSKELNRSSSDLFNQSNTYSSKDIDSSCMTQSITLTPRTSRRLAYEKIPGMKGQTRLIFH